MSIYHTSTHGVALVEI